MSIGSVENHRKREEGVLVYPVYSRRSGGLSVGINLFPAGKVCTFNCPYCEVFPFVTERSFSLALMETALAAALSEAKMQGIPVRDICFSGNGEPSQSPDLPAALDLAFSIRDREVPDAKLVLITNGTGLLKEETFELLCRYANLSGEQAGGEPGLRIWLKLDAGSAEWYKAINRSAVPFDSLIERIRAFAKCAPLALQTMICSIDGKAAPPEEISAWETLVAEIAVSALNLRAMQLYGKARPAPEDPLASALPTDVLEARAESIKTVLASIGKEIIPGVFP